MNKQEAISRLKAESWEYEDNCFRTASVIDLDVAQEIISQIDEPKKSTIPEFVAAWIGYKKGKGYTLFETLVEAEANPIIKEWLSKSRLEIPTLAWIFGHEFEKEEVENDTEIRRWSDGQNTRTDIKRCVKEV